MAIYTLTMVLARVSCTSKLLRCASQLSKLSYGESSLKYLLETEACAQLKSRAKKHEDTIVQITQELERVRAEVCEHAMLCALHASPPVAADRPARCGSATPCSRSARCWCEISRACSRQRSWRLSARMQRSRTCAKELPRSSCRRHRPCHLEEASLPVSFSAQQPVTVFATALLYLVSRGKAKAHHAHTAPYNFVLRTDDPQAGAALHLNGHAANPTRRFSSLSAALPTSTSTREHSVRSLCSAPLPGAAAPMRPWACPGPARACAA